MTSVPAGVLRRDIQAHARRGDTPSKEAITQLTEGK